MQEPLVLKRAPLPASLLLEYHVPTNSKADSRVRVSHLHLVSWQQEWTPFTIYLVNELLAHEFPCRVILIAFNYNQNLNTLQMFCVNIIGVDPTH